MRARGSDGALEVGATAGSYVTLLGMTMSRDECENLLGFAVHRQDHTANTDGYLMGQKAFRSLTNGRFKPPYSSEKHPLQGFQWADYTATPGHEYTYTVSALKGDVAAPTSAAQVSLQVRTEHPRDGAHDIYFNRGAAASQQYAEEFKNQSPDDVGPRAFKWLSRGLYEALVDFVSSVDQDTALRICAYEFSYGPLLDEIAAAVDKGADVQIIYDHRDPGIFEDSDRELAARGLTGIAHPRATSPSYISHNKFIVKLINGVPRSVWTGGTNFSKSGIFGHSNVAHVVEDDTIAANYLQYWLALLDDPANAQLFPQVEDMSPLPDGEPPVGTIALFSPRRDLTALQWYAARASAASDALFMTFAFGMNATFQDVYETATAPLRFALMESLVNRSLKGKARRDAEARMQELRNMPENTFAVGSLIKANALEGWLMEKRSSLTKNVHYVHNKFMLIDPLSSDPVVVNGSANFSDASTRRNDENMLVVRGDSRVADVFITEFMRMYRHHAFRESQQFGNRARQLGRQLVRVVRQPQHFRALARREGRWLIEPTDPQWPWWPKYFEDASQSARRTYFAHPFVI
jgi:phosphatidylserine/phosphatidylglycerophosphate/cardiolipin synthase-like enzyme